jgi:sterol desaturase/sphingolipid hydroxylase (fatty acid hydroxylase superfamily)
LNRPVHQAVLEGRKTFALSRRRPASATALEAHRLETLTQSHEPAIRLAAFLGVFALMALWEVRAPRRVLSVPKLRRWGANLGLVALNTLILRLLFPVAAIGLAASTEDRDWGLLNQVALPAGLKVLLAIIALDFAIWGQHVLFHAVPALWRLHRVHHADLDYDLTTGARFHPIEIVLSMLIKLAAVMVLGPSPVAVILFEVILNGMAMFNHGNVGLPAWLDRPLRRLLVTPDMHRVHHSVADDEANSNFGFNLSLWDRLFGTYRDQPRGGHEGMTLGIDGLRDPRQVDGLPAMLLLPFRGAVTEYAINRRRWKEPGP